MNEMILIMIAGLFSLAALAICLSLLNKAQKHLKNSKSFHEEALNILKETQKREDRLSELHKTIWALNNNAHKIIRDEKIRVAKLRSVWKNYNFAENYSIKKEN